MLGVKDLDRKILLHLDDRSLLNACQTDRRYAELCRSEDFWRIRYIQQFGQEAAQHKPIDRTWRNDYLQTVIDLENFPGLEKLSQMIAWDTQEGLSGSYWTIRDTLGFPILRELKPFREAPNRIMSWFWLKRLDKVQLTIPGGKLIVLENVTPQEVYTEASKWAKKRYIYFFQPVGFRSAYSPLDISKENLLG